MNLLTQSSLANKTYENSRLIMVVTVRAMIDIKINLSSSGLGTSRMSNNILLMC